MRDNSPFSPPEGWSLSQEGDQWCAAGDALAEVHPVNMKWWAQVCAPERDTREEAEKDRLAMVQALAPTPPAVDSATYDRMERDLALALGSETLCMGSGWDGLLKLVRELRAGQAAAVRQAARAEAELERLPTQAEVERLHTLCDRIGAPGGQPLNQRLGWAFEALSAQLKSVDKAPAPASQPPLDQDKLARQVRLLEGRERETEEILAPLYRVFGTNDLAVAVDEAIKLHGAANPVALTRNIRVALDEAQAPANESLVARIRGLGKQLESVRRALDGAHAPRATPAGILAGVAERIDLMRDAHWYELAEARSAQDTLLEQVRNALNVGPPSDSDVKPGTDPKRIVDIVRTRSELMLQERSRRVALAEEVQALERQIVQERQQAINRLLLWMSGERCEIASELLDQVARAVEAGIVTADDANDARRNRRVLATLVLNVDFGKPRTDDIPF